MGDSLPECLAPGQSKHPATPRRWLLKEIVGGVSQVLLSLVLVPIWQQS